MNTLKILSFTHKNLSIDELGKFHVEEIHQQESLTCLKKNFSLSGLLFLSTCNRVEFFISNTQPLDKEFFLQNFYTGWSKEQIKKAAVQAVLYEGEEALRHLFEVASSLDSLVVGEREIITQVRNAYENCKQWDLTDDFLRIVIQNTVETAKKVYTQTNIAKNPVSVVSLAYRKLKELNVKPDSKFIIIGAGVTNSTMAKYLKKHGFKNFSIFNRTLNKAEVLAGELGGTAFPLSELKNYTEGFDVIVTCTGSADYIITPDIYQSLNGNDTFKKVVIDLAVPGDLHPGILNNHDVNLIAVNNLQEIASANIKEREKELDMCKIIIENNITEFRQQLKARKVELAMSEVPKKVKEIRNTAINQVFAKDIEQLDENSKEVLDKVITYLEKKYISVPMKMAKEIIISQ